MAIYKTTTCKVVIERIYRDLQLEDPNKENDIIEWIGEAFDFIGSYSQMEKKNTELTVADYKVALPADFVSMEQVAKVGETTNVNNVKSSIIRYNPSSFFAHEQNSPNLNVQSQFSYTLNPDYIVTDFEEGTLLISYLAIPTDDEGYPAIPDNQYFKEAFFWYCFRQLILSGYKPRVSTIDYHFADEKWRFYCTAARNKANYPSLDEYERFADTWVNLLPSNRHKVGYDSNDEPYREIETIDANNVIATPDHITVTVDGGQP